MRILMISDFYPPTIGGLERHVQTLSRELVCRGHEVAVATLAQDGMPELEVDQGVRIHRLHGWNRALKHFYDQPHRRFHPTAPDPGVVAGLRRVMRAEQPDVVHARGWMMYSYLPIKLLYDAGLVVTLHDYSLVCPKKNYLYGNSACDGPTYRKCVGCASEQYGMFTSFALTTGLELSRRMHGLVDRYLAVSPAVAEPSERYAGGRGPIAVVPTFMPDGVLEEAATVGRPSFLPPEDGYLMFVGGLTRAKGLHVLLEAYDGLQNRVPLVLLGTPQADTPASFPEGVVVHHNVDHPSVMASWARAAVAVVPSVWPDPLPQTALEAMASGRPVVASRGGGLQDVISDGINGMLVAPGDPAELRRGLDAILSAPLLRERMGRAAKETALQYTVSSVISRIEDTYREVVTVPGKVGQQQ